MNYNEILDKLSENVTDLDIIDMLNTLREAFANTSVDRVAELEKEVSELKQRYIATFKTLVQTSEKDVETVTTGSKDKVEPSIDDLFED